MTLIVVGNGVGFLFAKVALSISVVSFPLLLDRDVGAAVTLATSVRIMLANPLTIALWGLMLAAILVIGSLPLFIGLTVTLPLLGHASWHLCRKARSSPTRTRARTTVRNRGRGAATPLISPPCFCRGSVRIARPGSRCASEQAMDVRTKHAPARPCTGREPTSQDCEIRSACEVVGLVSRRSSAWRLSLRRN